MPTNPYDTPARKNAIKTVRSRVGVALVCLHISALLYLLLGLASPIALPILLTSDDAGNETGADVVATCAGFCSLVFCLLIAAAVEVVAYSIYQRRFWGWVVGLILFGIYATSLLFPLGVLGLWGLLATGSRAEFGVGRGGQPR